MTLTTLTTKGQVTIPKEVRDELHLHSGDKIDIIVTGNGEAIIRPVSKKVDDVFGLLKDLTSQKASVEDMNQAIRDRFAGADV